MKFDLDDLSEKELLNLIETCYDEVDRRDFMGHNHAIVKLESYVALATIVGDHKEWIKK